MGKYIYYNIAATVYIIIMQAVAFDFIMFDGSKNVYNNNNIFM